MTMRSANQDLLRQFIAGESRTRRVVARACTRSARSTDQTRARDTGDALWAEGWASAHIGTGRASFRRDPRAHPPDRGQGTAQAASPHPRPQTARSLGRMPPVRKLGSVGINWGRATQKLTRPQQVRCRAPARASSSNPRN